MAAVEAVSLSRASASLSKPASRSAPGNGLSPIGVPGLSTRAESSLGSRRCPAAGEDKASAGAAACSRASLQGSPPPAARLWVAGGAGSRNFESSGLSSNKTLSFSRLSLRVSSSCVRLKVKLSDLRPSGDPVGGDGKEASTESSPESTSSSNVLGTLCSGTAAVPERAPRGAGAEAADAAARLHSRAALSRLPAGMALELLALLALPRLGAARSLWGRCPRSPSEAGLASSANCAGIARSPAVLAARRIGARFLCSTEVASADCDILLASTADPSIVLLPACCPGKVAALPVALVHSCSSSGMFSSDCISLSSSSTVVRSVAISASAAASAGPRRTPQAGRCDLLCGKAAATTL
mmetsp:Transcript_122885/g.223542  ORF Transcript_122885/g.223542 Transcript_122885/m.223542 type:complete len:355 (+) Transcript_122885:239-1303(+)